MFTIMQQYCIVKCWAIYSWEFQSILKGQCYINGASDPRVGYTRAMQVKITILSQAVGSRLELQCLCPGHRTRTLPSEEEPPPRSAATHGHQKNPPWKRAGASRLVPIVHQKSRKTHFEKQVWNSPERLSLPSPPLAHRFVVPFHLASITIPLHKHLKNPEDSSPWQNQWEPQSYSHYEQKALHTHSPTISLHGPMDT